MPTDSRLLRVGAGRPGLLRDPRTPVHSNARSWHASSEGRVTYPDCPQVCLHSLEDMTEWGITSARRGLMRVSVAAVVVLGSVALTSGAVRAETADTDSPPPNGVRVEVTAGPAPGCRRIVVDTEGGHSLVTVGCDACPHSYVAVTARTAPQLQLSLVWKRPCERPPAKPPAPPPPTPRPEPPPTPRPEPSPPSAPVPTPASPSPTPASPTPTPSPPRVTAPQAALPVPARPHPSKAAGTPSQKPKHPERAAPTPKPVTHRTYQAPPRRATRDGIPLMTLALLLMAPAVLAAAALRTRSSSRGGGRGR